MFIHPWIIKAAVFSFFLTCVFSPLSYADHVKAIESDGTMILESGKKICLEGLEMSPDASRFLPALLSKKDVDFEEGTDKRGGACGYLFVNTSQVELPFKASDSPEAKRYLVNEMLLQTGAAKVKSGSSFKLKEKFITLETEARKSGQGIWSYEDFSAKKSRRQAANHETDKKE